MKDLIIYHGGCTDGVAAAWAAWRHFGNTAIYWPGVYQQEPPWEHVEAARQVYLVDFSYKRPVMEEMVERCPGAVAVLDHHKTAEADLVPLLESGAIGGLFDMNRCGALITWQWFHGDEMPPELLLEIDKQDRWLNDRDPALIMALRSYPHRLDGDAEWSDLMAVWNKMMRPEGLVHLRYEGEAIYRYYRARVDETKPHAMRVTLAGPICGIPDIPLVNAPYYLASDVAGELAEGNGIGAVWWRNTDGSVTFSLRSRGDVDVSEIAVRYGGGGHKGAAGFRISWEDFCSLPIWPVEPPA